MLAAWEIIIPKYCQYFQPGDAIDASCDDRYLDLNELNSCTGLGGTGTLDRQYSQTFSGLLDIGTLPECDEGPPEICKYIVASEDSNLCNPENNQFELEFLDMMGCGPEGSVTQGGSTDMVCCEGVENCACKVASDGQKTCLSCNEDGVCQTRITKSLVDPQLVENCEDPDDFNSSGECSFVDGAGNTHTVTISPTEQTIGEQINPGEVDKNKGDGENRDPSSGDGGKKPVESGSSSPTPGLCSSFQVWNCLTSPNSSGLETPEKDKAVNTTRDKSPAGKIPKAADPVDVASGALVIDVTDLSFEGVKEALTFQRRYDSQSPLRGTLGSNWTHNWEVRIEPLKPKTAPSWASSYCKTWYPFATCLTYHDGMGNTFLYMWDPDDELYKPSAGRFDHIRSLITGGYIMTAPDGEKKRFNEYGYLNLTNDRFGNWKRIEYEATPVFLLYRRYCHRELEPLRSDSQDIWEKDRSFDPRLCETLAHMFNDQPPSDLNAIGINKPKDNPNHNIINLPGDDLVTTAAYAYEGRIGTADYGSYKNRVRRARIYLQKILNTGYFPTLPTGAIRFRPTKVRDNLGRTLVFNYNNQNTSIDQRPHIDFGLLESVTGAGGAATVFSYARPEVSDASEDGFPRRLNESFLSQAKRTQDTTVRRGIDNSHWVNKAQNGEERTIDYQYQWPQVFGSDVPSWELHHKRLRRKWKNYFGIVIGCKTLEEVTCPGGQNSFRSGNPCMEAEFLREDYISSVADNILSIVRSGKLEVFSDYETDPFAPQFDQITTQRFGGASAVVSAPSDAYSISTDLPSFEFDYFEAGPLGPFDNTDFKLPGQIKDRYPLETNGAEPKPEITCQENENATCFTLEEPLENEVDDNTTCNWNRLAQTGHEACFPSNLKTREMDLPGYQATLNYFTTQGSIDNIQSHNRSRLTCEQLARAALGDPFHNDLLSVMEPVTETVSKTDHKPRLITGHRNRVALDANRICSWTKTKDRDNTVMYYGMNFRSQALVLAVETETPGEFVFTDTFFNADGNVIEERLPQRGLNQSGFEGRTRYFYEDLDGNANNGWNKLLPAFWGKRDNLVEIIETPKFLTFEADVDDYSSAKSTAFAYEPLFNQLKSVTLSKTMLSAGETDLYRITNEFDYQEFADFDQALITPNAQTDEGTMASSLIDQILSGKHWSFDGGTGEGLIDNSGQNVIDWQFTTFKKRSTSTRKSIRFYNSDINGDGIKGFPVGTEGNPKRAKAVPIRVISEDLTGRSEDRFTYIAWSPNGLPADVLEPNGKQTSYSYYSIRRDYAIPINPTIFENIFGEETEPDANGTKISSGYRGLLAHVSWNEFDTDYPTDLGPDTGRCAGLNGPLQWMIPNCGQSNYIDELHNLNIPQITIDDIIRTQTNPQQTLSISYSELGTPYKVWENGRLLESKHDSDGRTVYSVDAKGNQMTYDFTIEGWSSREQVRSGSSIVYDVSRHLDNEGRMLAQCRALTFGGCNSFINGSVPAPGASSIAGAQIEQFAYSDGGLERSYQDPEGTITTSFYDTRKRQIEVRTDDPILSTNIRRKGFIYDDRNRLTLVEYGTSETQNTLGRLTETFIYDEYNRLISQTDTRGTEWQFAYSRNDELVKQRQSSVPYEDQFTLTLPFYFTESTFNGHGEMIVHNEHDIVTTTWDRFDDGRIASQTKTGGGTTYMSFDTQGRLVWQQSPHFDASMIIRNNGDDIMNPRQSSIQIARSFDGKNYTTPEFSSDFLTLTSLSTFNRNYERVEQKTTGNDGGINIQSWERSPLGYVTKFTNPEGSTTEYVKNYLGWVSQEKIQKDSGFQISSMLYNARGQTTTLIDPSNQATTWQYNAFGDLQSQTRPGSSQPRLTTYDGLGRVSTQSKPISPNDPDEIIVVFGYDSLTGDLTRQRSGTGLSSALMIQRSFDILGRVESETNFNVKVKNQPGMVSQITNDYTYDPLGRMLHDTRTHGNQTLDFDYFFSLSTTGWNREMTYPTGETFVESADFDGRIFKSTATEDGNQTEHYHRYMGGIYTGRSHVWDAHSNVAADPMEFDQTLDGFGRPISWKVNALQHENGSPVNAGWADAYCDGVYDSARCQKPLFKIDGVRDVMGRLRATDARFSHPINDGANPLFDGDHTSRWRSYLYEKRGFLTRVWEVDVGLEIGVDSLTPNNITNSDVNMNASDIFLIQGGPEPWDRVRDDNVGSLQAVRNANSAEERWATGARDPGHRLTQLDVDGASYAVQHDAAGRTTRSLNFDLDYDPLNKLAGAYSIIDGTPVELYAYDAQGRLSVVSQFTSSFNPITGEFEAALSNSESIGHDGNRMIVSMSDTGFVNWLTFVGPLQDQILEYHTSDFPIIPILDHRNNVVGAWDMVQAKMLQIADYNAEGRASLYDADEALLCNEIGNAGVNCQAPGGMPFAFNGRWRSSATGFVNMNHRWYSPRMGEFLSHDPLLYVDSYNLFGFATYDPINGYDPFGLADVGFSRKKKRIVQALWGFASGTGMGAAPLGFAYTWLALDKGLLQKKSRDFQLGYGAGEVGVGALEMIFGLGAILGGTGEVGVGILGAPETVGTSLVLVPSGIGTITVGAAIITEGSADIISGYRVLANIDNGSKTVGRAGTTIANEGGVKVQSYGSNDVHKPAHAHVTGSGAEVRIGPNGKPLKGNPDLTPKQSKIVKRYKKEIRKELNKVGRANKRLELELEELKKLEKK